MEDTVSLRYDKEFRYLDLNGQDMSGVTKKWELSETVPAPATEGEKAGEAVYYLGSRGLAVSIFCMRRQWNRRTTETALKKYF